MLRRAVGAVALVAGIGWFGASGPALAQGGPDPGAAPAGTDQAEPSESVPRDDLAESPTGPDLPGDDDSGSPGTTPTGDGEQPDRTTPTTVTTTSVADRVEVPEARPAADPDGGDARTEPNPLLVAGPSDGRRQLIPDADADAEADADGRTGPVTTEAVVETTDDAEVVVRRVVWGLIGLAVALSALAAYYWWITRPAPIDPTGDDPHGPSPSDRPLDAAPDGGGTKGSSPLSGGGTVDPWLTDSTSTR